MRLVEIRLLEGPNVYRLEPVVKVELALGRRRTWYGQRDPGRHALVRLGAAIPARVWPDEIAALAAWIRRLRADHGEGGAGLAVHRSSDPGHWIVTFPWVGEERARLLTEAALALADRDVSPVRTARLTGGQDRLLARWTERIADARTSPPTWIRDADRRIPVISISGTNGKSTVTRLITHILVVAGRHVGTTTSDGVLVDERGQGVHRLERSHPQHVERAQIIPFALRLRLRKPLLGCLAETREDGASSLEVLLEPDRMRVRHRLAPEGHGESRIDLLRFPEQLGRARILEVMQLRQSLKKGFLRRGSAGVGKGDAADFERLRRQTGGKENRDQHELSHEGE